MSKLKQYRAFTTIVERGGITNAAAALNLSVPAISKQLLQLEEQMKVQLFIRSHRKLELTDAGRMFYPKCKSILLAITQTEEEILSAQENFSGKLKINLSKSLCRSIVFDAISDFGKTYPDIQINIDFSDAIEDFYEKDIDFAFRLGNLSDNSTLVSVPLLNTQLLACATPAYIESQGKPVSFSNTRDTKFIILLPMNPSGELKGFLNRENFDFNQSVAHTTNDIEAVHQLVKANLGIGFLLDISIQNELSNGELVPVLTEYQLPRKKLHLLYKSNPWQSKRHEVFKDFIKDRLSKKTSVLE